MPDATCQPVTDPNPPGRLIHAFPSALSTAGSMLRQLNQDYPSSSKHTRPNRVKPRPVTKGGALFPSLTGLVADSKGYHISMVVPLAGFVVSLAYPIFLNTIWKKDLDSFSESKIGNTDEHGIIGDPAREDINKAGSKHLEG
ncbi:glucose/galactose transporter [Colletotrichum orchidophilum]|uniref:Glucose/galactose transporter n=1 Tax=Colletotrichum orchidophilum TaxID=1209926 RepID=A0A1G4AYH4_9PEZI|nr:glucose/galactose transporter [Colletotrichum orchidophilum]OHE94220.1 glucose/galactose transporter [Colletotrichum orchidophilum]